MSYSKEKREQANRQYAEKKKKEKRDTILTILISVLIVAVLTGGTIVSYRGRARKKLQELTPSTEYSLYLDSKGLIQGIDAEKLVGDFNLDGLVIDKNETTVSMESVQNEIQYLAEQTPELNPDPTLTVSEMDDVNIDYRKDYIDEDIPDEVETDYTWSLGIEEENAEIDDGLVGMHPGETKTIELKDAKFTVTVNGIMQPKKVDDKFIKETFPQYSTVEEYMTALRDQETKDNVDSAIQEYIYENLELTEYPEVYLHHMQELLMSNQAASYIQRAQMYEEWGVTVPYADYREMFTEEGETYEESLLKQAKKELNANVYYQYIAEREGIEATNEDFQDLCTLYQIEGEELEYYGRNYFMQAALQSKVLDYLEDIVEYKELEEGSDGMMEIVAEQIGGHTHAEEEADETEEAFNETADAVEEADENEPETEADEPEVDTMTEEEKAAAIAEDQAKLEKVNEYHEKYGEGATIVELDQDDNVIATTETARIDTEHTYSGVVDGTTEIVIDGDGKATVTSDHKPIVEYYDEDGNVIGTSEDIETETETESEDENKTDADAKQPAEDDGAENETEMKENAEGPSASSAPSGMRKAEEKDGSKQETEQSEAAKALNRKNVIR